MLHHYFLNWTVPDVTCCCRHETHSFIYLLILHLIRNNWLFILWSNCQNCWVTLVCMALIGLCCYAAIVQLWINISFLKLSINLWRNAKIIFNYHCYHRDLIKCKLEGFHQSWIHIVQLLPPNYFSLSSFAYSLSDSLWLHYDFGCLRYCLCLQRLPLFSQAVHSPPYELVSNEELTAAIHSEALLFLLLHFQHLTQHTEVTSETGIYLKSKINGLQGTRICQGLAQVFQASHLAEK